MSSRFLLPEFFENMEESARNKDTRAANGFGLDAPASG